MSNYDFLNLSPTEFEDLSRDLLQKQLKITLESFTNGRDGGIDLRFSRDKKKNTIVQCKRYKKLSDLMSILKKEIEKINEINPNYYLLTTSVPLTPGNKDDIKELLAPHIKKTSDIYGRDDLNNLLNKNNDVELNHFKLWIASTTVLNKVLYSKTLNQSLIEQKAIKKNINLFVENKSIEDAINILKKNNYVIISGIPGIGKTTLARMLVLYFMKKGFDQFIFLSDSINEGYKLLNPSKKQIFFFDDFLGGNLLETKIGINEEKRIVNFIQAVRQSKNKILILTSREYILKQAQIKFEDFENSKLDIAKCIIDLEKYTKVIRAKILYNHLFFSKIEHGYIENILKDKNYLKIINHKNYSPRIIEMMTIKENLENIQPNDYCKLFLNTLDNPEKIWKHCFENQITTLSQYLLYTLSVSGAPMFLSDLEKAIREIAKNEISNISSLEFKKSIKELENSFIISKIDDDKNVYINFQNPSVQDFLINYIEQDENLIKALIENSVFINQLFNIFTCKHYGYKIILKNRLKNILYNRIKSNFTNFKSSSLIQVMIESKKYYVPLGDGALYNLYYLTNNVEINEDIKEIVLQNFKKINLSGLSSNEKGHYVEILKKIHEETDINTDNVIITLSQDLQNIQDINNFIKLKDVDKEKLDELIKSNEINDEIHNIVSSEAYQYPPNELPNVISEIEEIEAYTEIDFTDTKEDLNTTIDEDNEKWNERANDDYSGSLKEERDVEDVAIENIFNSLKN